MEQSEHQAGQDNSHSLTVFYGAIHDQLTENIFFQDRCTDHHIEKGNHHVGLCCIGHKGIIYFRALQCADYRSDQRAHQVAAIHQCIAHDQCHNELSGFHTFLRRCFPGHPLHQCDQYRHTDQIQRQDSKDQVDGRILQPLRLYLSHNSHDCYLHCVDDQCSDQEPPSQTGKTLLHTFFFHVISPLMS